MILPDACKQLNLAESVGGGWLESSANVLAKNSNICLAVATVYHGNELLSLEINKIVYYLLPIRKSNIYINKELEQIWNKIIEEFKPDIVHIHGTEFAHGLSCMMANPNIKYIVSIQGVISLCYRYYFAGMSLRELIKSITFRDFVRLDTIFHARNKFKKRGKIELEYLKRTKYVIGRTTWDYTHTSIINPGLHYFKCNETLRNVFYVSRVWDLNLCSRNTIFLSQATYPLKGLHQVLKAVSLIKSEFPSIKIKIAGKNIVDTTTFIKKVKLSGYAKYIKTLIKDLDLKENIEFIGQLNEDQMAKELLNAHVFICPSSIENSPNSLGEAQILGVPNISSYVGGVPDMVENNKNGILYRFEEVEMLAISIKRIFNDDSLANVISSNAIKSAIDRHEPTKNNYRLVEIYNHLI